jgi:hypothetical protein
MRGQTVQLGALSRCLYSQIKLHHQANKPTRRGEAVWEIAAALA